jgi:hypothetical protein
LGAQPVEEAKTSSPWLTAPPEALAAIKKVIGRSDYKAYEGVNTGGLNGCFWIRVLQELPNGELLIENLHEVGKKKLDRVQASIEPNLVYKLVRARDVKKWRADPSVHIILAQDPATRKGMPEAVMKRQCPRTFSYLKQFETQLRKRSSSSVRRLMEDGPFYSMFAVGAHTLSPLKAVWPGQVATSLRCAVIGSDEHNRPILNDQTAYQVPFENEDAAYFFAAMMNSVTIRAYYQFVAYKHASMDFIGSIKIPAYSPDDESHRMLSELSKRCHQLARRDKTGQATKLEVQIDEITARFWKLDDRELAAIRSAVRTNASRKGADAEEVPDDDE